MAPCPQGCPWSWGPLASYSTAAGSCVTALPPSTRALVPIRNSPLPGPYLESPLGPGRHVCGPGAAGCHPCEAPDRGAASSVAGCRAGRHPPRRRPPGGESRPGHTALLAGDLSGHHGALQGPLPKSRVQGPIFAGPRGAHTLLGLHTLPSTYRQPLCPHSVPSRTHGLQALVCRVWQRPWWGPSAQESKGLGDELGLC